jgi:spermidine synthase
MAEEYFTEQQTPYLRMGVRVARRLHAEQTQYQALQVFETTDLGRLLALDDIVQLTTSDEFTYHEMVAHVPLNIHPDPRTALVIGGGDGGVVREALRHESLQRVDLVDIDEAVVRVGKEYFPTVSAGYADPRSRIHIADGIVHVRDHPREYDVVMIDSTDPIGPAVGLFRADFYRSVHECLREPGLFTQQIGSPFYNGAFIRETVRAAREAFPVVRVYLGVVPTYPGGMWCYLLGMKGELRLMPDEARAAKVAGQYYTAAVHRAAFCLPPFVAKLVSEA